MYRVIELLTGKVLAKPRATRYTIEDLVPHIATGKVIVAQQQRGEIWDVYLWWW